MAARVEDMTDLQVLMMDNCTRAEAERHLKNGSVVFEGEEFEKNFELYMNEWGIDGEDHEKYKNMIQTKTPMADWGFVEHEGSTWYISYAL